MAVFLTRRHITFLPFEIIYYAIIACLVALISVGVGFLIKRFFITTLKELNEKGPEMNILLKNIECNDSNAGIILSVYKKVYETGYKKNSGLLSRSFQYS